MNFVKSSILVAALALTACGSTKVSTAPSAGDITPINAQKLTTNFKRKGIKLEWDCAWGTGGFGLTDAMCVKGDIKAVEVTAYAPSFGNTENNRENAFKVAEMKAKAKLRHFIYEDVYSTNTVKTIAKNVEKANDQIRSKISTDTVTLNDDEPGKDSNIATRENTNETVRTMTETIRTQAQGILKGVQVTDETIVDRQTVAVTIRWDKDSERGSEFFQKKFR